MRKTVFRTGAAIAALVAGSGATAQAGILWGNDEEASNDLTAYYGDINPFYGNIDPFYGDISPFYGDINPFYADSRNQRYGDISPFWGDISPFWGDINPFYGNIDAFWGDISPFYGDISPFWGDIAPFWGEVGPMWGDIAAFWGDIAPFAEAGSDYETLAAMLRDVDEKAKLVWGTAIADQTGLSYEEAFADGIYAKWGIDLDDPSTLENLSATERSLFFLDFYDGLMTFSGVDHPDHWMATINWTPAITQDLGGGADARIGLLDAAVNHNTDILNNIVWASGYEVEGNFHGAAVASLLVSAQDGEGVMGIAPDAEVYLYNPFDETGTTNWGDVKAGIEALHNQHVDVINMSLGMPGYVLSDGWVDVLGDINLVKILSDTLLVKAAGNDGITQTDDIVWSLNQNLLDQLILVGSVGPTEEISWFSNRPGEACVVTLLSCREEDKLKYKFVVAPGELILVADDNGGLTRVSGTSFAAPLVSGTATLIMDRWPWLQNNPSLVADIIFNTAKDLGEPGVDGIYGWGLIDVEAALSPYAFENLTVYTGPKGMTASALKDAILTPGILDLWEDNGVVLSSIEYYTKKDYRDFLIPLSTKVQNDTIRFRRSEQRTQDYLYARLIDWAQNSSGFADKRRYDAPLADGTDWRLSMTARPLSAADDYYIGDVPFDSDLMLTNGAGTLKVRAGTGDASLAMFNGKAFGFASDHDPLSGGVNPVFGFASGAGYAAAAFQVADRATLGMAFSQNRDDHLYRDYNTGQMLPEEDGLSPYQAQAATLNASYAVTDAVTLNMAWTALEERDGLLGAQGAGALSLDGKVQTESATMGLAVDLDRNISLGASVTRGYTEETGFEGSVFELANGGAVSSAYEVAALKQGIVGKSDRLRLTVAQPLHVEDGALQMRMFGVVDRDSGALGPITQFVPLGGQNRPYVAEMLYATPLMDGQAELSSFSRAETNTRVSNAGQVEYSVGANFRMSF